MGAFVMLPRRLLRYLLYVLTALVFSSFVLLFAHKHELIVLDNYLPTHLTPSFFQPPSDLYIIDISVNNCIKWNRKSTTCGLPGGNSGLYGNLHTVGGWIKVPKDLALGRKLMSKEFLSYKQVQRKFFTRGLKPNGDDEDTDDEDNSESLNRIESENQLVIVDLAVADPVNDAAIKGNEKTKYPRAVLEDFASSRTFTDEDYQEMLANSEIPGDALTWDKSKSTSNQKAGEEINKLENEASRKSDEDKKKQSEFDSETPQEQLNDALKQDESKNEKQEENKKNKEKGSKVNDMEIEAEEKAEMEKQKLESESDEAKLNEALSEEEQQAAVKNKGKKKPLKEDDEKAADKEEQKKAKEELDKLMQENEKEKTLDQKDSKDQETTESAIDAQRDKYETKDNPREREHGPIIKKRKTENDRHALNGYQHIPTKEEIAQRGWVQKTNGIWARYGSYKTKHPVTAIDLLFGFDAVEPRPNWKLIPIPLQGRYSKNTPVFLTFRKGPKLDYKKNYRKTLSFNSQGKFKILQVADLHFSTGYGKCRDPSPSSTKKGCQADPRTLNFLETVLDVEKPDFVVLTGDQIFGDAAPDAETAVFKALYPFIRRGIPFAVTMGNHDDEGSLTRSEIMSVSASLPYSLAQAGPDDIAGVGNYMLYVRGKYSQPLMNLVFLDSHKYSPHPKAQPGYDWIKENQLKWLEDQYKLKANPDSLSMAFFHIPIPEYRNLHQPFIGENKEGVTAPNYNSGARALFGNLGIQVVSVGHDHCNDYCLLDTFSHDGHENKAWLCYGGGSGEGGYGGYGGYIRRLRIYEVDINKLEIKSWKRAEDDPNKSFDEQILVTNGEVVNF